MVVDEEKVRRYEPGETVLYEGMIFDQPYTRVPVRVVADDVEKVMLYLADGTVFHERFLASGQRIPRTISQRDYAALQTRLLEQRYPGHDILFVAAPGAAHAVRLDWTMPGRRFGGWYVNLETPTERTGRGFRSTDQFLDVVVSPNREWRLKDENELAEAVNVGRVSPAEADAIRREAERVIADIEAGRFPFDDSLIGWRPEPGWPIPRLDPGER